MGFTHKSADVFFSTLKNSGVKRLVDVRLNNVSQLAGFAKRDDLAYFLEQIADIRYDHLKMFAPTHEMLDSYKKKRWDWKRYESEFVDLMNQRRIETAVARDSLADACLLCSEDSPHHCHRRLVAEYLRERWGGVEIIHLEPNRVNQ